jgi:hypothetical protein
VGLVDAERKQHAIVATWIGIDANDWQVTAYLAALATNPWAR